MFKNYLKIVFRNLIRHKAYSFINIAGLAIGMACTILILLWVRDELSYDKFHEHHNEIYRVVRTYGSEDYSSIMPGPLVPILKEEFPEIVHSTRFKSREWKVTYREKNFLNRGGFVDADFFEIFTFPFVQGNPKTALSAPYSIVLTADFSRKIFGNLDPIGQSLKIEDMQNTHILNVTGVINNVPHNSHIQFDFLISYELGDFFMKTWGSNCVKSYVMLEKNCSFQEVNRKIAHVLDKQQPDMQNILYLQPITQIHLYALEGCGLITYLHIFIAMACVIILIACINFVNLTTARSTQRMKEVGIKKVVGSNRWQLTRQFLSESILLSLIAFVVAIPLVELSLPFINEMLHKQLKLIFPSTIFLHFIGISLISGIISGIYPAFVMSSLNPAHTLSSKDIIMNKKSPLRKLLVVAQFTLSIIFIVCSMGIYSQLGFIRNKQLGFDKENVIVLRTQEEFKQKFDIIKHTLLENNNILSIAGTRSYPVTYTSSGPFDWEGKQTTEHFETGYEWVDADYLKTFKMKMLEGRFFSGAFQTDQSEAFVINETAAKIMELENPVGKKLTRDNRSGTIIGVINDFHIESLHETIMPYSIMLTSNFGFMSIRIRSDNIHETLSFIENKIKTFVPDYPFEFRFLDEEIDRAYKTEQLTGILTIYITLLAILISCLGLFGLSSFTAEQSTKEIGIRKVLGASVSGIVLLLTKEFTKWVLIANIIAWPIAYYTMNKWLQNFAYRININLWTFLLAGVLALVIALMTVSFQTIKTATANPVEALRYE